MSVFIDTSAFIALLDADDRYHQKCSRIWENLLNSEEPLLTSNYVLVESFALIQHRLGMVALNSFTRELLAPVMIEWVTETDHQAAVSAVLASGKRKISLVDCVSFEIMRRLKIDRAFTCDRHFRAQDFTMIF